MDEYLRKPFEPSQVREMVAAVTRTEPLLASSPHTNINDHNNKNRTGTVTATISAEAIRKHLLSYYGLEDSVADRILATYAKELNDKLQMLQKAVSNQNGKEAGRLAHAIKGTFLNIGQKQLAETAHLLERELPEKITPEHIIILEQLIEELKPITEIENAIQMNIKP